jgi:hypothetical protein
LPPQIEAALAIYGVARHRIQDLWRISNCTTRA